MPFLNPDDVYKAALRQQMEKIKANPAPPELRLAEDYWKMRAQAARRSEDKEKAFEQFCRLAEQAHVTAEMLAPEPTWPFVLTEDDKAFLRSLPYPISPA